MAALGSVPPQATSAGPGVGLTVFGLDVAPVGPVVGSPVDPVAPEAPAWVSSPPANAK